MKAQPIPSDLEALVLQCLRKRPEQRPESAAALRDALRRCTQVAPWTSEEAAGWWRKFRSEETPRAERHQEAAHSLTVDVDASDRLTRSAISPLRDIGRAR